MTRIRAAALALVTLVALADSAAAGVEIEWQLGTDGTAIDGARKLLVPGASRHDDHVVDLQYRVNITYAPDQIREHVDVVTWFGTAEGVQSDGTQTVTWNASNETLIVREAAVIDARGRVHRFDPAQAQILDLDTYDVFLDQRELVLQLPGLAPGSIAVLRFERVTDRTRLAIPWMRILYPQGVRMRRRFELDVTWREAPPTWHNGIANLVCGNRDSGFFCSAEDLTPIDFDPDVYLLDVIPSIAIAEPRTWDQIIAEMLRAIDGALGEDDGVDGKFDELTAGVDGPDPVLARLHGYVSREIRYVSFSEGVHSVVPHAISMTLANLYGDCKDKAALLLGLLRRAGFDAYPVLVATNREDSRQLTLPGMAYFNHLIVCMTDSGSERCFDATDAYSGPEVTPWSVQGRVRLALRPGSIPDRVPPEQYRWAVEVESNVSFTDDGGQIERQSRKYSTAFAGFMRSILAVRKQDHRQRWAIDEYQDSVSNSVEPVFSFTGVEDLGPHLTIESNVTYPALTSPDEDLSYIEADAWLRDLVSQFRSDNEHFDFHFAGVHVKSRYRYDIPSRWQMDGHGADLELISRFGSLTRTYRMEHRQIVIETELTMPRRMVPLAELPLHNRFIDLVVRESNLRISAKHIAN